MLTPLGQAFVSGCPSTNILPILMRWWLDCATEEPPTVLAEFSAKLVFLSWQVTLRDQFPQVGVL